MSKFLQEYINRKPQDRVHIKYEVETEDGVQEKELPFVIGVMGDFVADNKDNPPLKEREFCTIDSDNFDAVMAKLKPRLQFRVENSLDSNNSLLNLDLEFSSLKDFEPEQLIQKIEALHKLKLARDRLRALLNRAECSESLEKSLEAILSDHQSLLKLAKELKDLSHE